MSLTQNDVYVASLLALKVSLEARFDALLGYPLNQNFGLEARITAKQIEALNREIDAHTSPT